MIRLIWGFSILSFLFSTLKRFIKFNVRRKSIRKNNALIEQLSNQLCNSAAESSLLEQFKQKESFKLFSSGWIIYFTILFFLTAFMLLYPILVYAKVWGFSEVIKALLS